MPQTGRRGVQRRVELAGDSTRPLGALQPLLRRVLPVPHRRIAPGATVAHRAATQSYWLPQIARPPGATPPGPARARVRTGHVRREASPLYVRVPDQLFTTETAIRTCAAGRLGGSAGLRYTAQHCVAPVFLRWFPRDSAGGVRLPPKSRRRRSRCHRRRRPPARGRRADWPSSIPVCDAPLERMVAVLALLPQGVPPSADGGQDGVSHEAFCRCSMPSELLERRDGFSVPRNAKTESVVLVFSGLGERSHCARAW